MSERVILPMSERGCWKEMEDKTYMIVCARVCVCVRQRERERESKGEREQERERENERVNVCERVKVVNIPEELDCCRQFL